MKIGLILPGDKNTPKSDSRLKLLFENLDNNGFTSELIAYSDKNVGKIEDHLKKLDIVLVWINPIQNGVDRKIIDAMLRRVSNKGVFVSSHPDTIIKMGTKDILYSSRGMSWGGDIYLYNNINELKSQLLLNLKIGSRVLKQYRGNGGNGIWRVELVDETHVRVLHAVRDSTEKYILLTELFEIMSEYGKLIDQPFISLSHGMVRAYMTQNKVLGFGHQYVTALMWPSNPEEPLYPKPRLYYPKIKEEYQDLRRLLEIEWIPELQELLDIKTNELPILWDADFLVDIYSNYKLCETNISSVYPFPEYGIPDIVNTLSKLKF